MSLPVDLLFWVDGESTEFTEMEDAALVCLKAAATGARCTAFSAFSSDLGVYLVLLAGLLADGVGLTLP